MVDHSLAIHRFHTRLGLTGLREEGPALGRELTRAVGELLPEATARALAPLLGSRDGVLRIDRLALSLRLGRGDVSAAHVAELLGRELARQVAEHTGHRTAPELVAGLAYWPDHASFAASYLAHRLRLAPAPAWAFASFQPLSQLAAHEAALELIGARPAILAALARLLGPAGAPRLAASLPEWSASQLLERLLAVLPAGVPADAESELAALSATISVDDGAEPGRAALARAAASLAGQPQANADSVRRVALLARLAIALAVLRELAQRAWGRLPRADDLTPELLALLPGPAPRLALAALAPYLDSAASRDAFARILVATGARRPPPAAARTAAQAAPVRALSSRIAGVGLLLPTMLAQRLADQLAPDALHRVLAAALGPEAEPHARQDPLLAALAPFDPRRPPSAFPPVPDGLRALVPLAWRAGQDGQELEQAAEGAAGWAACLVHAFATGLRGLEGSSLPYLRRQFLSRPGTLCVAGEQQLTLILDPMPLGVLLRLYGLSGWSGRLPHARDALLRIEIREG